MPIRSRFAALGAVSTVDDPRRAALAEAVTVARRQRDEARARLRVAAPRAANLLDPVPLDFAGAQATLDPGTLLLAYSIGPHAARVFVVAPAPAELMVVPLATDQAALAAEGRRFRELIAATRGGWGAGRCVTGAPLTELLLVPLAVPIGRAERLLVSRRGAPPAPLRRAARPEPASAARAPPDRGRRGAFDLLCQPLRATRAPSRRRASAGGRLGAPRTSSRRPPAPRYRCAWVGRRLQLRPLPPPATRWKRAELSPVAGCGGRGGHRERAKALPSRARVVHFACHGFSTRLPARLGLAWPAAPGLTAKMGFCRLECWRRCAPTPSWSLLGLLDRLGQEMAGEGSLPHLGLPIRRRALRDRLAVGGTDSSTQS